MKRTVIAIAISLFVTVALMVLQKMTGPTYPLTVKTVLGNEQLKFQLLRTQPGTADHCVAVPVSGNHIQGTLKWKRYKTEDPWQPVAMKLEADPAGKGQRLVAYLPNQPPAGKLAYLVELSDGKTTVTAPADKPVVIRFRGEVPAPILIAHILFMLFTVFFGVWAVWDVLTGGSRAYLCTVLTTVAVVIGGMILGPIVQKYAFGAFWTGVPFGYDLTDNKTLVVLIFWVLAAWQGRKKNLKFWLLLAFGMLVLSYIIPHSVLGSELDYSKLPKPK